MQAVSEMYRGRPSTPVKNLRRVPFFGSPFVGTPEGDKNINDAPNLRPDAAPPKKTAQPRSSFLFLGGSARK
jgi:hypothetical protein